MLKKKIFIPKRSKQEILKIEEVQTIAYVLILIITLLYGIVAMNSRYEVILQKEQLKYKSGTPPAKVEGVIMVIAQPKDVSYLSINWRVWMHDIRTKMNRTEIYIVTPGDMLWYPIGPVFNITSCNINDNFCLFKNGLIGASSVFPNLRYILSVTPSQFISQQALSNFVSKLKTGYHRFPILNSALKVTGKINHLDLNAGWFLSRRTAFDWIYKMSEFEILLREHSFEEATGLFFGSLSVKEKVVADPHFNPHIKNVEDFSDMIDMTYAEECPKEFRYFDFAVAPVEEIRNVVTWNLHTESLDLRRAAMLRIPKMSKRIGFVATRSETRFCIIN